jgi:transposase
LELKKKGATLAFEWETYKKVHPEGYGYSQFCELYRQWVRTLNVVMRQEHRAGEKLFSDFAGTKLEVTNPRTGDKRSASLFVCTLGASSFSYAEAFWSENSEAWCVGHANAFEDYFHGVVEVVVPDNPKPVIKKPCRYEPDIHPDFQNMASHFGVAVDGNVNPNKSDSKRG